MHWKEANNLDVQQQHSLQKKMARRKIAACLLNVSEGRNQSLVRDIAAAAVNNQSKWTPDLSVLKNESVIMSGGKELDENAVFNCKATVLNIFQDLEYNRSVITLAAPIEYLGTCILQACEEAFSRIDLRGQDGRHPRLGAVDLIPVHPLSDAVSLIDCGKIARKVGKDIVEMIPSTSVFFFGEADVPEKRGLVERRKEMKWYDGKRGHVPALWDIGSKPSEKCGLTAIGAIPYMTNFNVTISTSDLHLGKEIAKEIRASSPNGLLGVQSMAFPHMGMIEIACNVETVDLQKVVSFPVLQVMSEHIAQKLI